MDVWQAIQNRRTVHDFLDEPIEDRLIHQALELALTAPNHKFTFPWKFYVVGRKTRTQLAELAVQFLQEKNPDADEALKERSRGKVLNPGALVVFGQKACDSDFQRREDYASISCAIQNFTLSLAGHGLSSKWSSGKLTSSQETYRILDIDRTAIEIAGFLWVGKPAGPVPTRRRPKLDQVLEVRD